MIAIVTKDSKVKSGVTITSWNTQARPEWGRVGPQGEWKPAKNIKLKAKYVKIG